MQTPKVLLLHPLKPLDFRGNMMAYEMLALGRFLQPKTEIPAEWVYATEHNAELIAAIVRGDFASCIINCFPFDLLADYEYGQALLAAIREHVPEQWLLMSDPNYFAGLMSLMPNAGILFPGGSSDLSATTYWEGMCKTLSLSPGPRQYRAHHVGFWAEMWYHLSQDQMYKPELSQHFRHDLD